MNGILWALLSIALLIICALCVKIHLMQKAAQEIGKAFQERLTADTNTLIDLSSRDPYLRRLASDINVQLRLLRTQRRLYQRGDQEVKEAVTNLSHDLRTPLTAICGYVELLAKQELSPDARRYLEQIENRTQAMKNLTEELLRYSMTASGPELHLRPVELRQALEEALLAFYGALEQKKILPDLSLSQPKGRFSLDRSALERVLENVLSNVLKYSAGDLRVTLDEAGRIEFSNFAPGLDPLSVEKMFDRCYTVNAAQNSTGLGLSIARRLTEQMGGRISAAYKEGRLSIQLDFSQTRIDHPLSR